MSRFKGYPSLADYIYEQPAKHGTCGKCREWASDEPLFDCPKAKQTVHRAQLMSCFMEMGA